MKQSDAKPEHAAKNGGSSRQTEQATMLANRVDKRVRSLRGWCKRERVSCYRVYDGDIPEVPLAIDRYEVADSGDIHLVVAEFERRGQDERDPQWLGAMSTAVAGRLGVQPSRVHHKRRARQRGDAQYEKLASSGQLLAVEEGGCTFLVNLTDYLDTGLFLHHRVTRRRFAAEAAGKSVLNLFCYTAAFSVHAAAAGAASSVSVDMSNTYLAWAEKNFAANGVDSAAHTLARADARNFRPAGGARFDLAIVDPPTYSSSKRMDGTFDVQRDHADMLDHVAQLMRSAGVIYFSTNRRRFALAESLDERFDIEDITGATMPRDFRRRPHHAYRLVLR